MPALQGSFSDIGLTADSNIFADSWYTPQFDINTGKQFYDGYWIAPAFDKDYRVNGTQYWYNLEALLGAPPLGERVINGTVTRKALSGKLRRDGEIVVTLQYNAVYLEGLVNYCALLWSSLQDNWIGVEGINSNVDAVPCTLALKQRSGVFRLYHAYAHLPMLNDDYEQPNNYQINDLSLRFTLLTT